MPGVGNNRRTWCGVPDLFLFSRLGQLRNLLRVGQQEAHILHRLLLRSQPGRVKWAKRPIGSCQVRP
eukprot:1058878-Prorocentrum_minimum.AAC.1